MKHSTLFFAGWGNLVFFDTEEYRITGSRAPLQRKVLAMIPKLGSQWKIIHNFKPAEYHQITDPKYFLVAYLLLVLQLRELRR